MYGIIHKAVRSYILQDHGDAIWNDVKARSDLACDATMFLSSAHFDDANTVELVQHVAAILNISVGDAFEAVGAHWTEFAIREGYGDLFQMAGSTFPEFLHNLDRMHSSLKITLTEAVMPSFELLSETETCFQVRYTSQRKGLAQFVKGLLQGVAQHYGEQIDIAFVENGGGADFYIRRGAELSDMGLGAFVDPPPKVAAA